MPIEARIINLAGMLAELVEVVGNNLPGILGLVGVLIAINVVLRITRRNVLDITGDPRNRMSAAEYYGEPEEW